MNTSQGGQAHQEGERLTSGCLAEIGNTSLLKRLIQCPTSPKFPGGQGTSYMALLGCPGVTAVLRLGELGAEEDPCCDE